MIETKHIDAGIASLYDGQERARSLIHAALQKRNGHVFVDDLTAPAASCLTVGRFTCLAGDPTSPALCDAIRKHPPDWLVPATEEWERRIADVLDHRVLYRPRILFRSNALDPDHIARYRPTEDLIVEPILEHVAAGLASEDGSLWGYNSVGAFLGDHVGYTINVDGDSICHAGSYAIYDRGIELNVWTHPDHRGKGLATKVCAHLILDCLDRGLTPHWDAANAVSAGMAEKFGYRQIDTYRMLRPLGPGEETT